MNHTWKLKATKLVDTVELKVCSACDLQRRVVLLRRRGVVGKQKRTEYRRGTGRWEQLHHVPACGDLVGCPTCEGTGKVNKERRLQSTRMLTTERVREERAGELIMRLSGRPMTHDQFERFLRALEHSTLQEVVSEVADAVR